MFAESMPFDRDEGKIVFNKKHCFLMFVFKNTTFKHFNLPNIMQVIPIQFYLKQRSFVAISAYRLR